MSAGTAPQRVVLATHNAHKVEELRRILADELGSIELVAYDGPEPVEDGATFEENSLLKARAAARYTGLPAIADDSGISVDSLGGAPGIHSARYAGTRRDEDNVALLLANLQGTTDRTARFFCAASAVLPSGEEHVVLREWPGTVLLEAAGSGGFGYDPVFSPEGFEVSAAELPPGKKDELSHRRRAFAALLPWVHAHLG